MSDANHLHEKLRQRLATADFAPGEPGPAGLPSPAAVGIYRAQCMSRHLDRIARELQKAGKGFYTIGSAGHENMAAVAEALRDGLRLLEDRVQQRETELANIQAGVIAGFDQVDRGEFAKGSGEEAIERAFSRAVLKHGQ